MYRSVISPLQNLPPKIADPQQHESQCRPNSLEIKTNVLTFEGSGGKTAGIRNDLPDDAIC
jgi:hypothetical protein